MKQSCGEIGRIRYTQNETS